MSDFNLIIVINSSHWSMWSAINGPLKLSTNHARHWNRVEVEEWCTGFFPCMLNLYNLKNLKSWIFLHFRNQRCLRLGEGHYSFSTERLFTEISSQAEEVRRVSVLFELRRNSCDSYLATTQKLTTQSHTHKQLVVVSGYGSCPSQMVSQVRQQRTGQARPGHASLSLWNL